MKTWQILNDSQPQKEEEVINLLLKNRDVKKNSFFNPENPQELTLKSFGISENEVKKAKKRIMLAKKNKEKVYVYGDYDADGVTSTGIMWEALHKLGLDAMPYVPDRFDEGYGINAKSVENIKEKNPDLKLIVTVDNGIVAFAGIKKANALGIDVIVTDHHMPEKKRPKAFAIIHTTKIAGSAVAWVLARELGVKDALELTAIGTIADQMPLVKANRSFAKFGLQALKKTKRAGLLELIKDAGGKMENLGTYDINYIIAPRLNAMGRLKHGLDSLRLLCVKGKDRAQELSHLLTATNLERQKIVDDVVVSTKIKMQSFTDQIIFLSDSKYHEGVIGLAAGKLVEEFYRPAIVVSKGDKLSKGSARSILGFNIVEAIREQSEILVAYGGHTMAAGFTIETSKLEEFNKRLNISAQKLLTPEILSRKLKIDCQLNPDLITWGLVKELKNFEPFGLGNPSPVFLTKGMEVVDVKFLGKDKNHLKLKLKKDKNYFDAIGFNLAKDFKKLKAGDKVNLVYSVEENIWNGTKNLQLRIRDLHLG